MKNLTHILVTRFNVKLHERELPDAAWVDARIDLFNKYCEPSVRNQLNPDFIWVVLFDEDTGSDIIERLNGDFIPLFKPKETGGVLVDYIKENVTTDYVITTRLDSDDMVSNKFIGEIQKQFDEQDLAVINFMNGFLFNGDEFHNMAIPNNTFISVIAKNVDESLKTIFPGEGVGEDVFADVMVEIDADPIWVRMDTIEEGHSLSYTEDEITDLGFSIP